MSGARPVSMVFLGDSLNKKIRGKEYINKYKIISMHLFGDMF